MEKIMKFNKNKTFGYLFTILICVTSTLQCGKLKGTSIDANSIAIKENSTLLKEPQGIVMDAYGTLYITDSTSHKIYKVTPEGIMNVIAGTGEAGFQEDSNGAIDGINSQLNSPKGIALDKSGNLYVADTFNHRIRKITPEGITSTIAGTGEAGFQEDSNGAIDAINSKFNFPSAIVIANDGNLYVADTANHRIRKITPEGITSTIAGTGEAGFEEDADGINNDITSKFNFPSAIVIAEDGSIYVADTSNHRIRRILYGNSATITIAGTGERGFEEDTDGLSNGITSKLNTPMSLAIDKNYLYIADTNNHRIRKVDIRNGHAFQFTTATIAGNGHLVFINVYGGEEHEGHKHDENSPYYKVLGSYAEDSDGARTQRKESSSSSSTSSVLLNEEGEEVTQTVENDFYEWYEDVTSEFNYPQGITIDSDGNLYVADTSNSMIRKVTPQGITSTIVGKVLK